VKVKVVLRRLLESLINQFGTPRWGGPPCIEPWRRFKYWVRVFLELRMRKYNIQNEKELG
jgi:hypothetical protein